MHIPRPVLNAPCGLSPRLALLSVTAQPLPPGTAPDTRGSAAEGYRWWEGNLHTHWLWRDGDQFPELVVDWYARNGDHPLPGTMEYREEIGRVLQEVEADQATYAFTGDELYIRARIHSSRLKENPFVEGECEQAWTQPVVPPAPANQP
ncbi:MAG: hypothetical protein M5U12_10915 [Verrucomicrobia bacterium]|nr:hypothetical protein [Verrucomicrobiota bacterium]